MLPLDHARLACVLHEERVAEALQHRRQRLRYAPRISRQLRLLLLLSNRLIDLGQKLKAQALAQQPSQELIEA